MHPQSIEYIKKFVTDRVLLVWDQNHIGVKYGTMIGSINKRVSNLGLTCLDVMNELQTECRVMIVIPPGRGAYLFPFDTWSKLSVDDKRSAIETTLRLNGVSKPKDAIEFRPIRRTEPVSMDQFDNDTPPESTA